MHSYTLWVVSSSSGWLGAYFTTGRGLAPALRLHGPVARCDSFASQWSMAVGESVQFVSWRQRLDLPSPPWLTATHSISTVMLVVVSSSWSRKSAVVVINTMHYSFNTTETGSLHQSFLAFLSPPHRAYMYTHLQLSAIDKPMLAVSSAAVSTGSNICTCLTASLGNGSIDRLWTAGDIDTISKRSTLRTIRFNRMIHIDLAYLNIS